MATANPYMEVMGLTKRIGNRVLFHDISFTINEREHVGLIAKNEAKIGRASCRERV